MRKILLALAIPASLFISSLAGASDSVSIAATAPVVNSQYASEGAACSPTGLQGVTASGQNASCQNGVWVRSANWSNASGITAGQNCGAAGVGSFAYSGGKLYVCQ